MKTLLFSLALTLSFSVSAMNPGNLHAKWNSILEQYVNAQGMVDYAGLKKAEGRLDSYLTDLSANKPTSAQSEAEQLSFYINLYNAACLKVVLNHYPVKSIMDIKINGESAFDHKFIKLGNETISLGNIENDIIRKQFQEPRIHFALVCAAASCPRLLNEAYTAASLEQQLSLVTKEFLLDTDKNAVSKSSISLSKIFDWYSVDFGSKADLIAFVAAQSGKQVDPSAKVSFNNYNWELNTQ